ncbi:MAG: hypothetical protein QG656_1035 [Candidatus Hydrogenedentes bacterium]|nr:hypothetical protein [Candidatus Hydrogenedentota bacterium]
MSDQSGETGAAPNPRNGLARAGWVIVALVPILAGYFLYQAELQRRQFWEWVEVPTIDIPVDCSVPGSFSGKLVHTCTMAHGGGGLRLEIPPESIPQTELESALEGLRVEGTVTDIKSGAKTAIEASDRFLYSVPGDEHAILAASLPYDLPKGEYTLELSVVTGAQRLAGIPQRLVGRYMLCGMEMMPAFLLFLLSCFLLWLDTLLGLVLLRRHYRENERMRRYLTYLLNTVFFAAFVVIAVLFFLTWL